ncbi:hypothetical protein [Acinetobacter sp. ANC 4631]
MSKPTCPHCGSQKTQTLSLPTTTVLPSGNNTPQILHTIVSYALMGAATAQKFRANRQPWVLLAGVAVGGVMGCVVSYLNQQNNSNNQHSLHYHCQECQQQFTTASSNASFSTLWS